MYTCLWPHIMSGMENVSWNSYFVNVWWFYSCKLQRGVKMRHNSYWKSIRDTSALCRTRAHMIVIFAVYFIACLTKACLCMICYTVQWQPFFPKNTFISDNDLIMTHIVTECKTPQWWSSTWCDMQLFVEPSLGQCRKVREGIVRTCQGGKSNFCIKRIAWWA